MINHIDINVLGRTTLPITQTEAQTAVTFDWCHKGIASHQVLSPHENKIPQKLCTTSAGNDFHSMNTSLNSTDNIRFRHSRNDFPLFQYVSVPARSYIILVPVSERISEFDERFDLTSATDRIIALQLSRYAFSQESANKRFTERVRLEIAAGGNSIEAVIQGTVGRDADGKVVLMALHRVVVQIPVGAELELGGDIRTGHYPFRGRALANVSLTQGSPLLLSKTAFKQFWDQIDERRAWGFEGPINGASLPEGAFTFAQAIKQTWFCKYRSPARFRTFLETEHYPYLEDGVITEVGFNRLLAQKEARRARDKAKWQKTDRANKRRRARQRSLGAASGEKSTIANAVKAKFSCPQK